MAYLQPSVFGLAFASRLFREIDNPSSYQELVSKTSPALDVNNNSHCADLLKWLNKWGCRIAKNQFIDLAAQLGSWLPKQELPPLGHEIATLSDSVIDQLAKAYDGLRNCEFGPTAAAKTLFALRPNCAMSWDEPIRTHFQHGDNGDSYREMLRLSRQEAQLVLKDAERLGIADIVKAVGSSVHTSLAKLLDEYHWITITRGHQIPARHELELWLSWI